MPTGPAGPAGPVGPCDPCGPCAPVGPAGPVAPVAPLGPCGPAGPCGPTAPIVTSKLALVPLLTVSWKVPAPRPAGRSATICVLLEDISVNRVPSRSTVGDPFFG